MPCESLVKLRGRLYEYTFIRRTVVEHRLLQVGSLGVECLGV